jgi:hypothetical protein
MTIGELVGAIEFGPQYSSHEANQLIDEFHHRVTLEGVLVESDIKDFGYDVVESSNATHVSLHGVDPYQDMDLETLKDRVDWTLCSV